ncbi:MAG TPA: hypothetical protein VGO86_08380 [Candidatus Dormibacteraeota bacterium]|jgi:hypothetical protein
MTEPDPVLHPLNTSDPHPTAAGTGPPAARRARATRLAVAMGPYVLVLVALALAAALTWDDVRLHQEAGRQAGRSADLAHQLRVAHAESDGLRAQIGSLEAANRQLEGEAHSPTLAMWNSCTVPCSIGPNAVRVGSVPDTFQLLLTLTADVPVRVYVFTFHQWTQFDDCGLSIRCVTGDYRTLGAGTSIDTTFADAEGCSGYVWVLQADRAGTVTPNVRVHYQPADHVTGVCTANP